MRSILPPSERQLTRSIAVSDTLCHARFRAEFPASTRTDITSNTQQQLRP